MNRRAALKTLGTAAGAFLLDGCMRRGSQVVPGHPPELLHLPRVDVRPELEIRTVVGRRPFRPSGFVVRAENVGDKLVVHNSGHGGGGLAPVKPLHQVRVAVTAIEGPRPPFPLPYVRRVQTMMIEPSIYLPALMSDFFVAGGKIVVQEFHSPADVAQLSESTVVNCTGLGAHALFGDQELTAVKGQLTVLLPQPAVNYAAHFGDDYMFPRRDGVLLGGTHERDVWTLDPNPDAKQRVLAEHQQFFSGMKA